LFCFVFFFCSNITGELLSPEALDELAAASEAARPVVDGTISSPRRRAAPAAPAEPPVDPSADGKGSSAKSGPGSSARGKAGKRKGSTASSAGKGDASAAAAADSAAAAPPAAPAKIKYPPLPTLHRNLAVHPTTAAAYAALGLEDAQAAGAAPLGSARLPHPAAVERLATPCDTVLRDRGCYVLVQVLRESDVAARGEAFQELVREKGIAAWVFGIG
jgi:hypothetical protein